MRDCDNRLKKYELDGSKWRRLYHNQPTAHMIGHLGVCFINALLGVDSGVQ